MSADDKNLVPAVSPEERERLKEFFESDEWQKAQAKLKIK